jgi:hypothetical protein
VDIILAEGLENDIHMQIERTQFLPLSDIDEISEHGDQ